MRISRILLGLALGFGVLAIINSFKEEKHLFILAGQSNMVHLNPKDRFIPTLITDFGEKNISVVKDAHADRAIRNWFKYWDFNEKSNDQSKGLLYNSLISKVRKVYDKNQYTSVTFVWMQGESDALEESSDMYEANIRGLLYQLSKDLNRTDINCVIGRLSDYGFFDNDYKDWHKIRKIQLALGLADSRNAWVNTDDLNDGLNAQGNIIQNGFNYSVEGYRTLGERFAKKSIELIHNNKTWFSLISF